MDLYISKSFRNRETIFSEIPQSLYGILDTWFKFVGTVENISSTFTDGGTVPNTEAAFPR